jgi:hypothetical protein
MSVNVPRVFRFPVCPFMFRPCTPIIVGEPVPFRPHFSYFVGPHIYRRVRSVNCYSYDEKCKNLFMTGIVLRRAVNHRRNRNLTLPSSLLYIQTLVYPRYSSPPAYIVSSNPCAFGNSSLLTSVTTTTVPTPLSTLPVPQTPLYRR